MIIITKISKFNQSIINATLHFNPMNYVGGLTECINLSATK